jgi:hypothetical protein
LKEIITRIEIRSNPEKVWKVLTDFQLYKFWNPFIIGITGSPNRGEKIEIELRTAAQKTRIYHPVITKVDPPKELRWYGKAILPLILDGEHIFTIEENEEHDTIFTQKEILKGLGAYFGNARMFDDIRKSFQMMNSSLKLRAESNNSNLC